MKIIPWEKREELPPNFIPYVGWVVFPQIIFCCASFFDKHWTISTTETMAINGWYSMIVGLIYTIVTIYNHFIGKPRSKQ